MIDENILIERLNKRKEGYLEKYPDREKSLEIETINEFIHMIALEAKYQNLREETGIQKCSQIVAICVI